MKPRGRKISKNCQLTVPATLTPILHTRGDNKDDGMGGAYGSGSTHVMPTLKRSFKIEDIRKTLIKTVLQDGVVNFGNALEQQKQEKAETEGISQKKQKEEKDFSSSVFAPSPPGVFNRREKEKMLGGGR